MVSKEIKPSQEEKVAQLRNQFPNLSFRKRDSALGLEHWVATGNPTTLNQLRSALAEFNGKILNAELPRQLEFILS